MIGRIGLFASLLLACSGTSAAPPASQALAADAFVWGYPLVVTERTLQSLGGLIGVNTLLNQSTLSSATSRFIVSPNQDTLYSIAVLDLRSEPMVLAMPDVADRYWTYQFLDAWTNSFHYIGTRATGGKGGSFAILAPGWTGKLPVDVTPIEAPTPQVFLLGRYLVKGASDFANVAAIKRTLVPLHTLTGEAAPSGPPPLGTTPGTPQEVGSEGAAFFDELGDVLEIDPPGSKADADSLARFASLGVGAGKHPSSSRNAATLDSAIADGQARIDAAALDSATGINGWIVHLDITTLTDPTLRAALAKAIWGVNVPAEAVYATSIADKAGAPYSGASNYTLHFDKAALPPVDATNGFWSLTLYGPDHFFVDNALKRFAIGDRTEGLVFNADGSLDLYIQKDAPAGHETNWLPAPAGAFTLMLRLYLPTQVVLDGGYEYPGVIAN